MTLHLQVFPESFQSPFVAVELVGVFVILKIIIVLINTEKQWLKLIEVEEKRKEAKETLESDLKKKKETLKNMKLVHELLENRKWMFSIFNIILRSE